MRFTDVTKEHLGYVLRSKYADGDIDKAVELIRLQRDAFAGVVLPYNPNTLMMGAENRFNVTCYLDALLFAMFAKLSAFECMLQTDLPDGPPRKLAALIRLWVNMLRTGRLIYADMVRYTLVCFPASILLLFTCLISFCPPPLCRVAANLIMSRLPACKRPWPTVAGRTPVWPSSRTRQRLLASSQKPCSCRSSPSKSTSSTKASATKMTTKSSTSVC